MSPESVQLAYQICVQGRADLALAPDEATGFAMTLLRLLAFEPARADAERRPGRIGRAPALAARGGASRRDDVRRNVGAVARRRTQHRPGVAGRSRHRRTAATAPPNRLAHRSPRLGRVGPDRRGSPLPEPAADWPAFVARLRLTGMAAQLAAQSELKSIRGNALSLAIPATHKHLADKAYADKLKAALEAATGRKLLLAFEIGDSSDGSLAAIERRERAQAQGRGRGGVPQRAVRARPGRALRRDGPARDDRAAAAARRPHPPQAGTRHDEEPVGRPDEAGAADAGKHEARAGGARAIEVEGQSGAGLVKIVMTCRHDVKRVAIDPSLLGEDKDMLEDLVAAAFNDALRRAEATSQEKMGGLTAGMPLPPGLQAAVLSCSRTSP